MTSKEKLARIILATAEAPAADTPTIPAGLAERFAALAADLPAVRRILTPAYTVRPSKEPNAIHCASRTGMDDASDAAWASAVATLRQHFGARLLEVFENVCYRHTDFTIFLGGLPSAV